jgi:hypothetical protein
MPKAKIIDKTFLGQVLKASPNLSGVWMNENDEGGLFICIAHRGIWTITVSVGKNKFEGEGPTERKARIDFTTKLVMAKQAITLIERWETGYYDPD